MEWYDVAALALTWVCIIAALWIRHRARQENDNHAGH